MKAITLLFFLIILFPGISIAQEKDQAASQRRGLITSGPCPLTCKDLNVPRNLCRESRAGNTCRVEDFSQPPGHRSMIRVRGKAPKPRAESPRARLKTNRRGLITSSTCPYNCRMARVPKDLCRDWRAGDTCYVEDLTQPPGHRTRVAIRPGYTARQ